MISHLISCSITAAAALAVAGLLRGQRAAWRHAILFLALVRFAVPTGWLAEAGRRLAPVAPAPASVVIDGLGWMLRTPGEVERVGAPVKGGPGGPRYSDWIWAAGFVVCAGFWARRAWRGIPAVRAANQIERDIFSRAIGDLELELRIVDAGIAPGAWGWLRPRVILPDGLSTQLSSAELEAVIAHELAHIRRRDNLTAAIARAIVSVFWFHPLAWWIERRMLAERETACDELVLARGSHARDYAAAILKACRMSFAGAAGYAGVNGSNLENRMEFIMSIDLARRPSRAARVLLGVMFAMVVLLPVAGGYLRAKPASASPLQSAAPVRERAVPEAARPNLPSTRRVPERVVTAQVTPPAALPSFRVDVRFSEGVVLLKEQHYAAADEAFRDVLRRDPSNAQAFLGRVEVQTAQGHWDDALQMLEEAVRQNPERTDLRIAMGNIASRAGRYDQAIAAFEQILNGMDPRSQAASNIYLRIGETYRRKGDTELARLNLRRAVERDPENVAARQTLALLSEGSGDNESAERQYRMLIERDPKNGVALNNLAYLLSQRSSTEEALQLARRAREAMPENLEVSDTLGWVYLNAEKPGPATEIFEALVQKQPERSTFRYHLALALVQKGERSAAVEQLKRALTLNPGEEEARKIRQLLERIQ
jgi:Tfp pilus assembly protein PilF/Zn-dependent protease with chaperone function